jgi:hypothetical protein
LKKMWQKHQQASMEVIVLSIMNSRMKTRKAWSKTMVQIMNKIYFYKCLIPCQTDSFEVQ